MYEKQDYYLLVQEAKMDTIIAVCYEKVFRIKCNQPGFMVLDFGKQFSSELLRQKMVEIKNKLNSLVQENFNKELHYQWLGRFDQQTTTKLHIDNAPHESFLMLGYEPTVIQSELYFADFAKFCQDQKITETIFFEDYNPLFETNEQKLLEYITKVGSFFADHFKIVLMNNSHINTENSTKGVLHQAKIIHSDLTKERIINSMMFYMETIQEKLRSSKQEEQEFISTTKISR